MGRWFESAEGLKWPCLGLCLARCLPKNFLFKCICFSCLFCFFPTNLFTWQVMMAPPPFWSLRFPSLRGTSCCLASGSQMNLSRPVTGLHPESKPCDLLSHVTYKFPSLALTGLQNMALTVLMPYLPLLWCTLFTKWGYLLFSGSAYQHSVPLFYFFLLYLEYSFLLSPHAYQGIMFGLQGSLLCLFSSPLVKFCFKLK